MLEFVLKLCKKINLKISMKKFNQLASERLDMILNLEMFLSKLNRAVRFYDTRSAECFLEKEYDAGIETLTTYIQATQDLFERENFVFFITNKNAIHYHFQPSTNIYPIFDQVKYVGV